jgi:hypothetical protein
MASKIGKEFFSQAARVTVNVDIASIIDGSLQHHRNSMLPRLTPGNIKRRQITACRQRAIQRTQTIV